MPEMTNTKTWSKTRLEGAGATNAIANRDLFWKIKDHLKTVGWSVVASSNGVDTYGAADYWTAGTSIVSAAAGSNHSWIVLANSSICVGYQLCIDFSTTTNAPRTCAWYLSTNGTGFTGGSLTARPTAADEALLNVYTGLWTAYSSGVVPSANVFSSSDAQNFAIFLGPTTVRGMWLFGRATLPKTFWTKPGYAMVNSGTAVHGWFNAVTEDWMVTVVDGVPVTILLGTLMYGTTRALESATVAGATGDAGGLWPTFPVWLISNSSSYAGILGTVPDLWWLHSNATLALGDTFPASGTPQQVVIGNFGVGYDGSTLTL
jgi:hypothetical protein